MLSAADANAAYDAAYDVQELRHAAAQLRLLLQLYPRQRYLGNQDEQAAQMRETEQAIAFAPRWIENNEELDEDHTRAAMMRRQYRRYWDEHFYRQVIRHQNTVIIKLLLRFWRVLLFV